MKQIVLNTRDLIALTIKVAGLLLLVLAVAELPDSCQNYLAYNTGENESPIWWFLLPLSIKGIFGLLFFIFPYQISSTFIFQEEQEPPAKVVSIPDISVLPASQEAPDSANQQEISVSQISTDKDQDDNRLANLEVILIRTLGFLLFFWSSFTMVSTFFSYVVYRIEGAIDYFTPTFAASLFGVIFSFILIAGSNTIVGLLRRMQR